MFRSHTSESEKRANVHFIFLGCFLFVCFFGNPCSAAVIVCQKELLYIVYFSGKRKFNWEKCCREGHTKILRIHHKTNFFYCVFSNKRLHSLQLQTITPQQNLMRTSRNTLTHNLSKTAITFHWHLFVNDKNAS